ncbi:branched-chain amino acid ABC transporter permease [Natronomonas salina]|uniref:branched-chain amino acid ABC transporter permease n=1 Tax=Natronomonas salina TaxID=1710540 RepID=UPI001BA77F38|nr:branched-chain amino acid ABC transporter permease [Natronomonas salina]
MSTHSLVFEQIITGISIGSRLFLVAVGLSLIFGVLDVLNFTHGVLYMLGAYVAIVAVESTVGSFLLGIVAAIFVVAIVGGVLEAVFIRRLYGREEEVLDQLLLTFAFVLIITDAVRAIFGSQARLISAPDALTGSIPLGAGLSIPTYRAFVILMALLVLGAILAVLRYTNVGRIVRATSSDREMARLLGINVPKLYTGVFVVGAALAGLGGALAAPLQSVSPSLGNSVIVEAFVVVVIGGLGSFFGAFVGAMIIGLLIALGSGVAGAGDLFPFLAMIVVLVWRPTGLFGGAEA